LTISKDHLTLKGEKKEVKEEKGENFYRKERSFGSFHREIPLPCEVLNDKASAVFKKGVLNITIPKSPQAQQEARQIPIKGD
jgi:HSP20 family protein